VDLDIYDMGERKQVLSNAVLGDNRCAKKTKLGEADTGADDIGAIGRILQGALARVRPAAAAATMAVKNDATATEASLEV
jgi:hypothetical protein